MKRLVPFVVVAILAAAPAALGSSTHHCGDYTVPRGGAYTALRASRASCATARAVVRGWDRSDSSQARWRRLTHGWRCHYLTRPVRFSCVHGRATVRFNPGEGF